MSNKFKIIGAFTTAELLFCCLYTKPICYNKYCLIQCATHHEWALRKRAFHFHFAQHFKIISINLINEVYKGEVLIWERKPENLQSLRRNALQDRKTDKQADNKSTNKLATNKIMIV